MYRWKIIYPRVMWLCSGCFVKKANGFLHSIYNIIPVLRYSAGIDVEVSDSNHNEQPKIQNGDSS